MVFYKQGIDICSEVLESAKYNVQDISLLLVLYFKFYRKLVYIVRNNVGVIFYHSEESMKMFVM